MHMYTPNTCTNIMFMNLTKLPSRRFYQNRRQGPIFKFIISSRNENETPLRISRCSAVERKNLASPFPGLLAPAIMCLNNFSVSLFSLSKRQTLSMTHSLSCLSGKSSVPLSKLTPKKGFVVKKKSAPVFCNVLLTSWQCQVPFA